MFVCFLVKKANCPVCFCDSGVVSHRNLKLEHTVVCG